MLEQETIIQIKKVLDSHPVQKAMLFGSRSRGDERIDSDVDLLLHFAKTEKIGLFRIGNIQEQLSEATGKNVQVTVKPSQSLMAYIQDDLKEIYEKGR